MPSVRSAISKVIRSSRVLTFLRTEQVHLSQRLVRRLETSNAAAALAAFNLVRLQPEFSGRTTWLDDDADEWPFLDIAIVGDETAFLSSLSQSGYPAERLRVVAYVTDPARSANENERLTVTYEPLSGSYVDLLRREVLRADRHELLLMVRGDVWLEQNALKALVWASLKSGPKVAAWEPRCYPVEQPKYYDPVTSLTPWASFDCILLRRSLLSTKRLQSSHSGLAAAVDLSYEWRRGGVHICYCAAATLAAADVSSSLSLTETMLLRAAYPTAGPTPDKAFPFHGRQPGLPRLTSQPSEFLVGKGPLVSVIVRTYQGRERFLREAMQSVLNQTHPALDIIVAEDGGRFQEEVLKRIDFGSRKVKYLSLPKVGRSATGNAGLAAADGEFVCFLDDDDLLFHDHISSLSAAFDATVDATYAPAWSVETSRWQQDAYREHHLDDGSRFDTPFSYERLLEANRFPIQGVLFRRSIYLEEGGFDPDLDQLEDWNLWLRYARNRRFKLVRKATSIFRIPASRMEAQTRHQAMQNAYDTAKSKALAPSPQIGVSRRSHKSERSA